MIALPSLSIRKDRPMEQLLARALMVCLAAISFAAAFPAAAQSGKPLATRELDVEGVVAEVTESVRKEGVLTVRVKLRNTGERPAKILLTDAGRYDANYITSGDTKYVVMRDVRGRVVATPMDGGGWLEARIRPRGSWSWWAKFPAPPAERKTYTLYLKIGPPIEDVPIIDK